MNKKLLRKLFPLIAVLVLAPWPIAYGYSASGNTTEQTTAQIIAADSSTAPKVAVFGQAISSVEPGDLFYINSVNQTSNIEVTLSITNSAELIHNYRYLILKVGVYMQDASGNWVKAASYNGSQLPDTFITLQNGQVQFELTSNANYKLTIDGGSVKCNTITTGENAFSPQFYVEVE